MTLRFSDVNIIDNIICGKKIFHLIPAVKSKTRMSVTTAHIYLKEDAMPKAFMKIKSITRAKFSSDSVTLYHKKTVFWDSKTALNIFSKNCGYNSYIELFNNIQSVDSLYFIIEFDKKI